MKQAMRFETIISQGWKSQARILRFQSSEEELLALGKREFCWGLFWVWLAGVGRAWDNPAADLFVKLGIPSLIYIFLLSFYLWLFILPLRPNNWSLKRLTIFISMTGILGCIYAIPVEKFMAPQDAATANSIFLSLVAIWRVNLLAFFLARTGHFKLPNLIVALLLPLSTILNVVFFLDTEAHTVDMMGGIYRYYVKTDPVAAKKFEENYKSGKGLGRYSMPSPAFDAESGKPLANLYTGFGPAPEGFKEIEWGDPRYVSTNPLMNTLRRIEKVNQVAWPVMAIYYLAVGFVIPLWNWWNRELSIVKGQRADEEKKRGKGLPGGDSSDG